MPGYLLLSVAWLLLIVTVVMIFTGAPLLAIVVWGTLGVLAARGARRRLGAP
jgi:uncharacterized MnhB-related membrane protein